MSRSAGNAIKIGRMTVYCGNTKTKRNPTSLRAVFATIVRKFFDNSTPNAADRLAEYGGIYASERQANEYKTLNGKSLEAVLKDSSFVQYWQIESIGRFLHVPAGVVLLISRVAAARQRGKSGELEALISGLRKLVDCIENNIQLLDNPADELDIDDNFIDKCVSCFKDLHEVTMRKDDLFDHQN